MRAYLAKERAYQRPLVQLHDGIAPLNLDDEDYFWIGPDSITESHLAALSEHEREVLELRDTGKRSSRYVRLQLASEQVTAVFRELFSAPEKS